MTIKEVREGDNLILYVSGRIDANTSNDLQSKVLLAFQSSRNVTLDLAEVDYVSSAGLRIFILGDKTSKAKGGIFKLLHVNDAVREILNTVGLIAVLHIE